MPSSLTTTRLDCASGDVRCRSSEIVAELLSRHDDGGRLGWGAQTCAGPAKRATAAKTQAGQARRRNKARRGKPPATDWPGASCPHLPKHSGKTTLRLVQQYRRGSKLCALVGHECLRGAGAISSGGVTGCPPVTCARARGAVARRTYTQLVGLALQGFQQGALRVFRHVAGVELRYLRFGGLHLRHEAFDQPLLRGNSVDQPRLGDFAVLNGARQVLELRRRISHAGALQGRATQTHERRHFHDRHPDGRSHTRCRLRRRRTCPSAGTGTAPACAVPSSGGTSPARAPRAASHPTSSTRAAHRSRMKCRVVDHATVAQRNAGTWHAHHVAGQLQSAVPFREREHDVVGICSTSRTVHQRGVGRRESDAPLHCYADLEGRRRTIRIGRRLADPVAAPATATHTAKRAKHME